MNGETVISVLPRGSSARATVRQIAMPKAARAISTLSDIDYEDAFLVEVSAVHDRTGEQWARAALEDAPVIMRSFLLWGWSALGLQPGSTGSDGFVLGWEVQRRAPDFALLGASSRIGMPAELLFRRQQHKLLFATFIQHENAIARAVWAGVEPLHRQIVRYVLEQAGRRSRS